MKQILLYSLLLLGILTSAQVGIGTATPAAGTLLHIDDGQGDKGILIPEVEITDLSTAAPLDNALEVGTLVFNSTGVNEVGFYYWSGNTDGWLRIADSASDESIYTKDGSLNENRVVDMGANSLQLNSIAGPETFTLKRTNDSQTTGLAFRNSGNFYDASIFMEAGVNSGLVIATVGNQASVDAVESTLVMGDDGQITLSKYTSTDTAFNGTPISFLGVDAGGNVVKSAAANSTRNIYDTDGTLTEDRTIQTNDNYISFVNTDNRDFKIVPAATIATNGVAADETPFQFTTNNSFEFRVDAFSALGIKANSEILLGRYNDNTFLDNSLTNRILTVSNDGTLNVADQSILRDNIYTSDGALTEDRVLSTNNNTLTIENDAAANQASQNGALLIKESFSNPGTATGGSLTFEHGNNQASSIVFRSGVNGGSDYGYIRYEDDGSGNGSTVENSLLTIGVENDGTGSNQDDINIDSAGSLGINNATPHPSASIDMGRNNQGLLINRVALSSLNNPNPITNPANGLLVFNSVSNFAPAGYINDVRPGFYYWNTALSRWIPQTPESRSARWTSTNTTTNLNVASPAPIIGSQEWNDDPNLYAATVANNASRIQVLEDGIYNVIVNIPISSSAQRTNIDAEIILDRGGNLQYPGGVSSANYVRNASGHDHSTIMINETIQINRGDFLYVSLSQEAAGGQVLIRSIGAANITITKIK